MAASSAGCAKAAGPPRDPAPPRERAGLARPPDRGALGRPAAGLGREGSADVRLPAAPGTRSRRDPDRASAYELRADAGSFDLHRFEQLVGRRGPPPRRTRTRCLREALSLWRGPPLAEFAYEPWAQPEIARLEELRLEALQERIEADLALGASAELVGELELLVGQHPLRERLRGQLMLALYRSGRQADALAAYRDARRALVETLGIEPTLALRQLERAILDQDPALDLVTAEPPAAGAAQPGPSLQTRSSSFVGRTRELREIRALLRREDVRLLTLTGAAGSGKTRLALEVTSGLEGEPRAPCSSSSAASPMLDSSPGRSPVSSGSRSGRDSTAREALLEYLRDRQTLLLLDNFEHVLVGRAARPRAARRRTRREGARHEPCSSRCSRGTGLPGAGARAAGSVAASLACPAAPDRGDPAVRRSSSCGPARLRALRDERRVGRRALRPPRRSSAGARARRRAMQPALAARAARTSRTRGSISCGRRRARA